jgi:hypothetical protein
MDDALNNAVIAVVRAAKESGVGSVESITIYAGANGEYPYQVRCSEETHPLGYLAIDPDL